LRSVFLGARGIVLAACVWVMTVFRSRMWARDYLQHRESNFVGPPRPSRELRFCSLFLWGAAGWLAGLAGVPGCLLMLNAYFIHASAVNHAV